MVRLVIEVVVENGALDGPSIIRAVPHALETVHTALYAGVAEAKATIAPAGVNEPVNVTFTSRWESERRLEMPETEAEMDARREREQEGATP